MVAGSPVQGLMSWKVSVTPWNGIVVDVACAKAGRHEPKQQRNQQQEQFPCHRALLTRRASKGWRDRVELGCHPLGQQRRPPFPDAEIVGSTRGTTGRNRAWKPIQLDKYTPPKDGRTRSLSRRFPLLPRKATKATNGSSAASRAGAIPSSS